LAWLAGWLVKKINGSFIRVSPAFSYLPEPEHPNTDHRKTERPDYYIPSVKNNQIVPLGRGMGAINKISPA
jgi:hypothetical protein